MDPNLDVLEPLSSLSDAIRKRRRDALKRSDDRATIRSTVRLLVVLAAATALFLIFFGFRIVNGNGMYPALSDGDLVLTYFKPSFVKGEIVFYEVNGAEYCGRIVAREGDHVDFSEDGKLYVNGTAQVTDVVFPTYPSESWAEGGVVVPQGSVFLLGDYRTQAEDSRVFGFIPKENITVKAIALLRHKQL